MSANEIIRPLHSNSEVFLMIIEKRSIGHYDEGQLVTKRFEYRSRACSFIRSKFH